MTTNSEREAFEYNLDSEIQTLFKRKRTAKKSENKRVANVRARISERTNQMNELMTMISESTSAFERTVGGRKLRGKVEQRSNKMLKGRG
jgi:hypothetical protein